MNRREAIAALTSLPASVRLSSAEVKSDDVVIVECDEPLHREQVENIRRIVSVVWPTRKVLVCEKGLRIKLAGGA